MSDQSRSDVERVVMRKHWRIYENGLPAKRRHVYALQDRKAKHLPHIQLCGNAGNIEAPAIRGKRRDG